MKIELAHAAERCAAIMEETNRSFLEPLIARLKKASEEGAVRKKASKPMRGTRIIASSPALGSDPGLLRAIEKTAKLLKTSLFFDDPESRSRAADFLSVHRAFLETLGTVSQAGAAEGPDVILQFSLLAKCCMLRGKPKELEEGSKSSWSNLFEAEEEAAKAAFYKECEAARAAVTAAVQDLSRRMGGMDEARRNDAQKLVSSAENLLESCGRCIFIFQPRKRD